ncbi:MAG: metallophosphoesterase [Planctomycetota bacterium]|nr:MAG: metallophosphoesterase [Planctomycetota bacterium]
MKLIYATDLHGSRESYNQLFDEAPGEGCGAILVGADILPKRGFIVDSIIGQREYIRDWLRPRVEDFRAKHPDIPVFWMFGNDDWAANFDLAEEMDRAGLATLIHDKAVELEPGLWLAGYPYVPLTPFGIKDWDRYDTDGQVPPVMFSHPVMSAPEGRIRVDLEKDIRPLGTIENDMIELAGRSDPAETIYMFHAPPAGTGLEITSRRERVGSRALRDFIMRHQPPVTLHGHIHESPAMSGAITERMGKTLAINQGASEIELKAVVFDTENPEETLARFGNGWE